MDIVKLASESEQKILNILLDSNDRMTVKEICKMIEEKEKIVWNNRTISTFLSRLEDKGFVSHDKVGITYYYYAIVKGEDYKVKASKGFLQSHFAGSITNMLSAFNDTGELSKKDIKELKDIVAKLK